MDTNFSTDSRLLIVIFSFLFGLFPAAVNAAEDCPKAARLLAAARALDRSAEETEGKLREVVKTCPTLAEGHYYLGLSLSVREKNAEAKKSFAEATRIAEDPRFFLALAKLHIQAGDTGKAEKQYRKVLQLNPKSVKGLQGLSVVQQNTGRVEEAEETLRRALQIDSSVAELYYNLAVVLLQQGRLDEAVTSASTALDKKPNFAEASLLAASTYRKLDKLERAEASARNAALYRPEDHKVWFVLGQVLRASGSPQDAHDALLKAEALAPRQLEVLLAVGMSLEELGNTQEALSKLQKTVELHSRDSRAYAALGWLYLRSFGQSSFKWGGGESSTLLEAEQALKTAVQLDAENASAHNNLGLVFELSDRPDVAKTHYEIAKKLMPQSSVVTSNVTRLSVP